VTTKVTTFRVRLFKICMRRELNPEGGGERCRHADVKFNETPRRGEVLRRKSSGDQVGPEKKKHEERGKREEVRKKKGKMERWSRRQYISIERPKKGKVPNSPFTGRGKDQID